MQRNGTCQHPGSIVEHPGRLPAAGSQQRARTIGLLNAFQLLVEEVQRFIPRNTYKAVISALIGIALMALTQPVHADHRVANTRPTVYVIRESGDHF